MQCFGDAAGRLQESGISECYAEALIFVCLFIAKMKAS